MTDTPKIKGKEAVKAALIDSASQLFAQRGIAGVSVRDIAQNAQVNHGLVHRHFGSKDRLVEAVLDFLSQEVHLQLEKQMDQDHTSSSLNDFLIGLFQNTEALGLHWRVLSHALLEGMDPHQLQNDFPVFHRLVDLCTTQLEKSDAVQSQSINQEEHKKMHAQATAQAILYFSTGLGLLLFKPYLQRAVESQGLHWSDIVPHLLTCLSSTHKGT